MTGFGSHSFTLTIDDTSKTTVTITVKVLNSRFFETTSRLPYLVNDLETRFIKQMKDRLKRGHAYITINIQNQELLKNSVVPSLATIRGYINATNLIKKECSITGELSLGELLRLPNVFISEERNLDETTQKQFFDALDSALDYVCHARQQEGLALKADMLQRIAIIEHEINAIESAHLIRMEQQKIKVQTLLTAQQEELAGIKDKDDEFTELRKSALYATLDKLDIHEEIVRFKSHITNLAITLESSKQEKGKQLDFTLQELGREINTIAAKCSDADIGSRAITIKVELEKTREQTQNLV